MSHIAGTFWLVLGLVFIWCGFVSPFTAYFFMGGAFLLEAANSFSKAWRDRKR